MNIYSAGDGLQFWSRYLPKGYKSRPSQVEFVEEALRVLSRQEIYVVSAPCGIGKSLAALISTIPLVERSKKLIVAYRTRNQLQIYLKELKAISRKRRRDYLAVSVISKSEMCPKFKSEAISYGALIQACRILRENSRKGAEPACEYYGKILRDPGRAYKFAMGCSRKYLSPPTISNEAQKKGMCPYEALKLVLPDAEIFLGTYHYLFEPKIRSEILRLLETDLSKCVVIVDEAHNLPSFARDLLSGELSEAVLPRALDEIADFGGPEAEETRGAIEALSDEVFPELSKGLKNGGMRRISPLTVGEALKDAVGGAPEITAEQIHDYGEYVWEERIERGERVYSHNHAVGEFLSAFLKTAGPQYAHWVLRNEAGEASLELRSLDGRELTNDVLAGVHSGILMSGTLTPAKVYSGLVARELDRIECREFGSPFPPENRLIVVAKDVSSRMEERTRKTYERWSEYVSAILDANSGNAGVFFTSYELMNSLMPLITTSRKAIVERKRTTREEVVKELSKSRNNVLFGVVGGKLSEGIDYPGNLLTCAVVVGFPYANWNDYQLALVEYMDSVFPEKGRLYGYLTPAILRLLQACGRVHRSERDKGCIVILDKRVHHPYIRQKLPDYFQRELQEVSSPKQCAELIEDFWKRRSG